MKHGDSYIVFELNGMRREYDGDLPDEVIAQFSHLRDPNGFWADGYPTSLNAEQKDDRDELPAALWDIKRVGGEVIEVHSTGKNGAIHWEDWKRPRMHSQLSK